MTLYKIRARVVKLARRANQNATWEHNHEEIIVDNIDTARAIFREQVDMCKCSTQYAGRTGFCELFIPKIHENGCIAYYPHDEKTYIEKWEA